MQHTAKQFSEQLNKCLDDLEIPANARERAVILGKMLDIPKQQAWSLLEGQMMPDSALLQKIADELEVSVDIFMKESK